MTGQYYKVLLNGGFDNELTVKLSELQLHLDVHHTPQPLVVLYTLAKQMSDFL